MNNEMINTEQQVNTQGFSTAANIVTEQDYSTVTDTGGIGVQDAQDIQKFLERPLLVQNITSNDPSFTIFPWQLLLSNVNVEAKLWNYRFVRGDLHLRITVTSTAYVYGAYIASIIYGQDSNSVPNDANLRKAADFNAEHQIMDIASRDTLEFTIPYFWKFPYLHTDYNNYLEEVKRCCRLRFQPLQTPLSVSSATPPTVTIKVYAWLSNSSVNILEPSPLPAVFSAAQSGPVSGPLNTGATIVQGAQATMNKGMSMAHTALKTASGIAQLLGFSRPQAQFKLDPFIPRQYDDTASTTGVYSAMNLTMDPGSLVNNIHMDLASSGDEMSFAHILERESYVTTYTIPVGADLPDTTIPVLPCLYFKGVNDGEVRFNNLGFVSLPFKYWRGSLDYHFRVIASNFHGGRIGVMWAADLVNSLDYKDLMNVSSNGVFEIGAGVVQTIRVNWGKAHAYCPVSPYCLPDATPLPYYVQNGYLKVFTVDQLTSPIPEATVTIVVTCTPGPDFEVCVPDQSNMALLNNLPLFKLDELIEKADTFEATILDYAPGTIQYPPVASEPQSAMIEFNARPPEGSNSRHIGDPVVSFRALLKRMQYNFTVDYVPKAGQKDGLYFYLPPYGIPAGQTNPTDVADPPKWTDSKLSLLTYVSSAYAGVRGGTYVQVRPKRHQNAPAGAVRQQDTTQCIIFRSTSSLFTRGLVTNLNANTPQGIWQCGLTFGYSLNGSQTFDLVDAPAMVHIPFHSAADYFEMAEYFSVNNLRTSLFKWSGAIALIAAPNESIDWMAYDVYYATADDFDCLHYNGPPSMYYYTPTYELPGSIALERGLPPLIRDSVDEEYDHSPVTPVKFRVIN